MATDTKPLKLLELRINSVTDAKAIVQHQAELFTKVTLNRLDGIEFIVAKEVDPLVGQYIDRLFRTKTYKQVVAPKNGNLLGAIPHLQPPKPKLTLAHVNEAARILMNRSNGGTIIGMDPSSPPAKRRGRPPKVKV